MTLGEFCAETHNYFYIVNGSGFALRYVNSFTISGGTLELPGLKAGQFYRISGSVFNDGVHQYPSDDHVDEIFDGVVYPMAVPPSVIKLADDITAWQETNAESQSGPYQSESCEGYSYTKATRTSASGANLDGYAAVFYDRLKPWRKLHEPFK